LYQAKRSCSIRWSCALGGYQQHDVIIALRSAEGNCRCAGQPTVIGTGEKIDAVSASLANALMIRCYGLHILLKQDPSPIPCRHFSGRYGMLRTRQKTMAKEFDRRM